MDVKGYLTEDELVEYIGLRLKLETLNNIVDSPDYSDTEKIKFMNMYLKEA